MNWINLKTSQPPNGELVATKIDDANGSRNEQPLRLRGRLWYVHWHPIDLAGAGI